MIGQTPVQPCDLRGLEDLVRLKRYLENHRPPREAPESARRRYNRAVCFVEHDPLVDFRVRAMKVIDSHAGTMPSVYLGLDGEFHAGKTQIATSLAIEVCRQAWGRTGKHIKDRDGRHVVIPVVYVVAGNHSEKGLIQLIQRGLNSPEPRDSASATEILGLVAKQCRRSRTSLIVIDDTHQLQSGRGRTLTKFLKQMFSTLPATLLFIADNLDETFLLRASGSDRESQVAADQLSKRILAAPYNPVGQDKAGVDEWLRLVDLTTASQVLGESPDLEAGDYAWLYQVCDGQRGRAMKLLLQAGVDAVGSSERINRDGLEAAAQFLGYTR